MTPAWTATATDCLRSVEELQEFIRDRSIFPSEQTETIIGGRFRSLPKRLVYAMGQWPFRGARVLDLGCSYGHCLVHFAPGSVGLDNVPEHVEFCRSLGLDARLWNVEQGLDIVADGSFDIAWVSDIVGNILGRTAAPLARPGLEARSGREADRSHKHAAALTAFASRVRGERLVRCPQRPPLPVHRRYGALSR